MTATGKSQPDPDLRIAVVGLGYVGLPLALAFGRHWKTVGYDPDERKVSAYRRGEDPAGEVEQSDFVAARHLTLTTDPAALSEAGVVIVAVPTPIDGARRPDFGHLVRASETVGAQMKRGAIVVYESTVYPGATEEVCVPVLERVSGMTWRRDFHVGYSPERINPGDREHTLSTIVKLVAGDDEATRDLLAGLYGRIVEAGVYVTSSIQVAEAAKVIENTQRDLNIALVNELAIIFHHLGLDTVEVLEAAGSKWNFLPFRPGLVGGHCIGVDPYYLTHKAEMLGYHPQVILAGRHINDGMAKFVAEQTVKTMIRAGNSMRGARVNVLGLTFKENTPDLRNSQVAGIVEELKTYGVEVFVHDPLADGGEAQEEYGIQLTEWEALPVADAVILAVAHDAYVNQPLGMLVEKVKPGGCFIDVKSVVDPLELDRRGLTVWRL